MTAHARERDFIDAHQGPNLSPPTGTRRAPKASSSTPLHEHRQSSRPHFHLTPRATPPPPVPPSRRISLFLRNGTRPSPKYTGLLQSCATRGGETEPAWVIHSTVLPPPSTWQTPEDAAPRSRVDSVTMELTHPVTPPGRKAPTTSACSLSHPSSLRPSAFAPTPAVMPSAGTDPTARRTSPCQSQAKAAHTAGMCPATDGASGYAETRLARTTAKLKLMTLQTHPSPSLPPPCGAKAPTHRCPHPSSHPFPGSHLGHLVTLETALFVA
jgi:hypothetical protein